MELYICLTIISWISQSLQAKDCERDGQALCCSGYRWNKTIGRCDKCPVGYSTNCMNQCYYPSYGEDCAKECKCPQEQCDHVFGCLNTTQAVTYRQNTENTTDGESQKTPPPGSGTSPASIVFYTTITLLSVFLLLVMFYGVSSLCKYISSRREATSSKSDLNFNETGNSLYDCVEIPRHI